MAVEANTGSTLSQGPILPSPQFHYASPTQKTTAGAPASLLPGAQAQCFMTLLADGTGIVPALGPLGLGP